MPGVLARAVPWIAIAGLLVLAYRLWIWAADGGVAQTTRARLAFFAFVLAAAAIVILGRII